jgi:protein-tyrosine kinase
MSRIEEALRRASVPAGPRGLALRETPAVPQTPSTTLADYPEEAAPRKDADSRSLAGEHSTEELHRQVRVRRSESDAGKRQTRAPKTTASLGPFPSALDGKLILNHATPVAVEQYRRLAASLHELQGSHGTKTVMVTSALPREGKTLTVCNLAMTLSESYGRRVLLIDADLRRPSVHEVFRLSNVTGLSDGLRSDSAELSLVQLSPRLSVLPAGRADSNPMAGLTSERMRALVEESAQVFDWVLLDAPPVGIMPDANLVSRLTQGVIFVVGAGSTPHQLVTRAVTEIGRENIIGVVFNRLDPESMPQTSYYDHYYQPVNK